jgi:anthranilate phosphoribosyltransferase
MSLTPLIAKLIAREDLGQGDARTALEVMVGGDEPPERIAGFLTALQTKGVTAEELAGFAGLLREGQMDLAARFPGLVDTCGTGGGRATMNLSTGAAIVAASAGAKVAKHGNRAVTSQCGSADVLEALGIRLEADPERLEHALDQLGIVFLFAPSFHPSLAKVGPVRRALGVRTVFNQLGPLANPVGAKRQVVGVYSPDLIGPMAEALRLLGAEEAFVVHSRDGLDEVSPCAPTDYAHLAGGEVHRGEFGPEDFGLPELLPSAVAPAADASGGAQLLREALTDPTSPRSWALTPTATVAVYLAGIGGSLREAARIVRDKQEAGVPMRTLEALVAGQA